METRNTGIDPLKYYQRKGRHSESTPLKAARFSLSTGNDQQIVAAVSGKRIRVMGLIAQSTTSTAGSFTLQSASGGAAFSGGYHAPANTLPPWLLPITDSGYWETEIGEGLFSDVATAAITGDIFYIEYTP